MYINDLHRNLKTVKTILFANDKTIVQSANNTEMLCKSINDESQILRQTHCHCMLAKQPKTYSETKTWS